MTEYGALLREIAVPRLTGSPGNERVRAALKRELGARGFVVMEHPFPASAAALRRVALCGALFAWTATALGVARLADLRGYPLLLLALLVIGSTLGGLGVLRRRPPASGTGVNLVAVRRRGRVAVWLTAHYDSKGQPISMATRLVAVGLTAVGLVGLAGFVTTIVPSDPAPTSIAWLLPGVAGGLLLSRNQVTNESPGAIDNGSGVLAVLATVDALPPAAPVGVILTDAEEFGLQGAHALVRERATLLQGTSVVNFDGIDDRGPTIALMHRPGPTAVVLATVLRARRAGWLPVLVDGLAFRRPAAECVTIVRGGFATTRIVHTPRDTPERLTLAGVREVAAGVARGLEQRFGGPGESLRLRRSGPSGPGF